MSESKQTYDMYYYEDRNGQKFFTPNKDLALIRANVLGTDLVFVEPQIND